MKKGKVYLVGAGPGGKDLITVKGWKILRQADVVIYDYLVDKRLLDEAGPGAELICCDKLRENRYSDGFAVHQEKISGLIVRKAEQGKKVVRLKNGDPSIFGRLLEEMEALAARHIEFEVVPGVTAATAAAAYSGVPLTNRRFASACVFVTGHEDPNKENSLLDWGALSKIGTIVLYMGVANLKEITGRLIERGRDRFTPAAIIKDAGLITQRTLSGTLKDIAAKAKALKLTPPAIIIIGKTAGLGKKFNWWAKNKRILFTGLSDRRYFIKGTYFHLPLIKIEPLKDYTRFDGYLKKTTEFDWIVFTSRYGVEYFFKRLEKVGFDARILHDLKIAAIGDSTAGKLRESGMRADLVPKDESSRGLLAAFNKADLGNKNIFLPHSDISDKGLAQGLRKLGAKVNSCVAYSNVMPDYLPDIEIGSFNEIMFTSPSGVRNFVKRYGRPPKNVRIKCIGEVTRQQAGKLKLC